MQTTFGRRPVLLTSTLVCLASNIWRAVAKDYRSFMGACILNGIGAGVAEVHKSAIPSLICVLTNICTDCSARYYRRHYVFAR